VYKDSDRNRWIGKISMNGRVRRVYAPTKTEARAKLNAILGGGAQAMARKAVGTSVATLLDDWIARDVQGRGLAPSSLETHRWATRHLKQQIGHITLDALSVRDVEAALDRLATEGLGRSSLVKILNSLTQALTFAERRDEVGRNVARLAKLPPSATPTVPRRSLSPDQARQLLEALKNERNGAMFALALRLGLRPGEAAGLYWEDLDLDIGTVNVTRGVRLVRGGRAEVVDDLKTSAAKRTLAVPPDLTADLAGHRRAQAVERLAASRWIDDRLVFASPTGNVLSPPNVRRQLTTICEHIEAARAESDPDGDPFPTIRPNELRHSCASYLSDQGVSNEVIADVLGHTTTRMVDQTYRHRLRPVVDVTRTVDWSASAK
jgi:integrase